MQEYQIPKIMLKAEKVIQSCITLQQLGTALKFKKLTDKQLDSYEQCALHGYFICKAHSLGYKDITNAN